MESPQLLQDGPSPSTTQQYPPESPSVQLSPSSFPHAHGKSGFCSQRALAAQLATAVFVAGLVLLLWVIYAHNWDPESAVAQKAMCCKREAQELYHHVNLSISPCRSLYHHVCGQYEERPEPVAFKDFRHYYEKDFYTAPNSTVGKAVHIFFQSCVSATANVDSLGGPTAAAYIDVLHPTFAEVNTQYDLLVFLMRMTVKYNMQPIPTLALLGRGGWPRGVHSKRIEAFRNSGLLAIILRKTRPEIKDVIAGRYKLLREDCLITMNKRMNQNVTLEALEILESKLDLGDFGNYVFSNFSLVDQIVTPLNVDDWRRIVINVSNADVPKHLYHGNVQLISKAFSILLNDTRRLDNIVFFIFEAASDFFLEHLKVIMWTDAKKYFTFCRRLLHQYSRMQVTSAIAENSKSREHDSTFRNMFTEIVTEISRRVKRSFPAESKPRLSSYLKSLKILLPSDIFRLNKWMPPLSSNYVRNRLILFEYDWSSLTNQPPNGVSRAMAAAISLGRISAFNDTVLISIDAYSALYFGNGTEGLVFLSVIGVQIADVIWRQIFYFGATWSTVTSTLVRGYIMCAERLHVLVKQRSTHFALPLLSVETAIKLARDTLWFRRFQAVLLWPTSRCQLFYLLFIYHHYCPGNDPGKPALAREAQYIASISSDFRTAFKCQPPKEPIPTCSLNAEK